MKDAQMKMSVCKVYFNIFVYSPFTFVYFYEIGNLSFSPTISF